jgi:urea carboxylase-associated protein 1
MAGILLDGKSPSEKAKFAQELYSNMHPKAVAAMGAAKERNGPAKQQAALSVDGRVIQDQMLDAKGGYYAKVLPAGTILRIIDLEGQQAVDFLCFDNANRQSRYNNANSIKLNRNIYVTTGFALYSDTADVLMTVTADSVGRHDTIGGACSSEVNELRYGIPNTCSCRGNFLAAMEALGMQPTDIHANINFFMNVPVHLDGSTQIEEGLSEPFDYVELRAEKEVLVVMSNCPQFFNPCSGWNPSPIRIIEWLPPSR